jgi:glucosamine-6-phosphate deaminase
MEVVIQPNAEDAACLAARLVAHELRRHPDLVLGLATGRTMERVYRCLVNLHRRDKLDFSRCRTFNLDEYIGLPPEDPRSYRWYMDQHLFRHVNVHPGNTHLPDGTAKDLHAECERYERLIKRNGGIDLQLLGIGSDGHIGFNEPLSSLLSRTRDKALTPSTLRQNAPMFGGDARKVPRRALTMGVGTILEAHQLVVLVTGETKAEILAKAVEGPITSMVTASAIQLHPHCKVVVDEEAASRLHHKSYYRWIFDHEPDWQPFRRPAKQPAKRKRKAARP